MAKRIAPKISDKFANIGNLRNSDLSDRITELEKKLADSEAVRDILLSQIKPNLNQPRSSFYVVGQKIESLRRDGQKTPIVLTKPPGCEHYQIWDGECRFRASLELGWQTIKAIVIPHNEETYEIDVLISAVQDDGLNAFDLARNLAKVIQHELPELETRGIYTKLNSALTRVIRKGRQEDLKGLEKRSFEERQEILQSLELSPEELIIAETILNFRQNLTTFCKNKFPLLFLNPEVIEAIKERGLGNSQAMAIDSIKPENKRINITETEARTLRLEMIENCLLYNLSRSEIKKQVSSAIAPYLKEKKTRSNLILKRSLANIEAIEFKGLEQEQKQLLIDALKQKLELLGECQ